MKTKTIDSIFNVFLTALAFAVPFFFLPITVEYFEFNKLYLIALATFAMMILWAIKMLITKDVSIVKSKVDLALLLMLGAVIVSAIFSINRGSSIFGATGRWFPTLLSYLVFTAFYYVTSANVSNEKTIKNSLYALIVGTTVTVLVGMLIYFDTGLIKSSLFAQLNFSLTGARLTLAILSTAVFGLAVALLGNTSSVVTKALLVIAGLLNLFSAVVFGETTTYILLAITIASLLLLNNKKLMEKQNLPFIGVLGAFTVLLVLLMSFSSTRTVFTNAKYPQEPRLAFSEAWRTSISSLRDFPITGAGPSTFYLNYTRYKSPAQNYTPGWNINFDKPNNEALNIVATMGLIGIIAFIYFVYAIVKFNIKNENELSNIIAVAQITAIAAFFLSYGTVMTAFLLFLTLALQAANFSLSGSPKAQKVSLSISSAAKSFSLLGETDSKTNNKEVFHYVVAALLVISATTMAYFMGKYYMGEYYMRKALNAAATNNGGQTYTYAARAIKFNPRKDTYQTFMARTSIALANSLENKKNLSDQDKQTIQSLIMQAVQSSRLASEVLNPLNPSNWQTRAFIYGTLRNATKDAYGLEIQSYNTAIRLDPTNPNLRISAGGPYYAKEDYLAAGNLFAQAVNLKNDHANARYNLAFALLKLKSYERARQEFIAVQKLVDPKTENYKELETQIKDLDEMIAAAKKEAGNVAGAADAKLSVDDLDKTNATAPVSQEPLVEPDAAVEAINNESLTGETQESTSSN